MSAKQTLEFSWASEGFALLVEHTLDGERVQKEQEQKAADRTENERKQLRLTERKNEN